MLQAIQAFEMATGRKLRYELGARRDGDVVETYASVDKAARVLGWRSTRSIVDAMRDAFAWQEGLANSPLG